MENKEFLKLIKKTEEVTDKIINVHRELVSLLNKSRLEDKESEKLAEYISDCCSKISKLMMVRTYPHMYVDRDEEIKELLNKGEEIIDLIKDLQNKIKDGGDNFFLGTINNNRDFLTQVVRIN